MNSKRNGKVALRTEGVWFAYREPDWILKDVSLACSLRNVMMIMGPSGSGKTTLLKVLAGILRPQRGKVEVLGVEIQGGISRELRPAIGYIPQQLGLVRSLTALENVLIGALSRIGPGRGLLGLFPGHEIEQARAALDLMGISHKVREKVFRLSGGERQRVAIARTLLQRPRLVLADEFVSDLDFPRAAEILTLMRRVAEKEDIAFVMNMHDAQLVQEFGDQVLMVSNGQILHECSAQEINLDRLTEVAR